MTFDLNSLIKFLTWLASPVGAFVAGSCLALLLMVLQRARFLRVAIMFVVSLQLIVFAMPVVSAWLHESLERQSLELVAQRTDRQPYAAIVLLGGAGQSFPATLVQERGRADFGDAVDRIIYAAQLYHDKVAPRIIVSGGNWRLDEKDRPSEASSIRDLLIRLGVAQQDILLEERSRTTRENFLFTDALLKQHGLHGPVALVTSATHIPRAVRNANALSIEVSGFPTDWRSQALRLKALPWLPDANSLAQSEVALKEWLANIVGY